MPIKQIFPPGRHEPRPESPSWPQPTDRRRPIQQHRGNQEAFVDANAPFDPLQVDVLSESIDRELVRPLHCLRAALESRLRYDGPSEEESRFLQSLLLSVTRTIDGAERIELAVRQPPIQPLICTTNELGEILRRSLPEELRPRVELHCEPEARTFVDAPLLGRSLAQVLSAAMDDGSEAHTSFDLGSHDLLITLRVYGGARQWLDLGARLGLRELKRLGADLCVECSPSQWSLRVELPTADHSRSEAAA